MTEDYPELHEKIDKILHNPKNLSTESELKEHANSAIAAFRAADIDSSGSLSIPELVSLCSHMGLPMEDDEEEGKHLKPNYQSAKIIASFLHITKITHAHKSSYSFDEN